MGWVLLVVLGCLFIAVSNILAHALLVRSLPAAGAELDVAPTLIELWFSEPLEPEFSTIHLVDAQGNEIAHASSLVDPADPMHMSLPLTALPPGIYTVVWRTLSGADGHEWVGSFPITLLNPDGTRPASGVATVESAQRGQLPTPVEVVTRWLSLMGAIFLLGMLSFRILVAYPTPVEQLAGVATAFAARFQAVVQRSVAAGLFVAIVSVFAGGWLQMFVQARSLDNVSALPDLLLRTRTGNLILYRQCLNALLLLSLIASAVRTPAVLARRWVQIAAIVYTLILAVAVFNVLIPRPGPFVYLILAFDLAALSFALVPLRQWQGKQRLLEGAQWLFGAAVLFTFSIGSHAAAVAGRGWAILADYVHLIAAAVWLGGLLLLALLLWQLRQQASPQDMAALRHTVRRFSLLATVAVFVLLFTGLFSSLVQLHTFSALWSTAYGWVLLAKIFLVFVALGIALLNKRIVDRATDSSALVTNYRTFLRQVGGESLLGVGVMLVVAMLVQTPVPPAAATTAPIATNSVFNAFLTADDLAIHLQISPNQVGNNQYVTHLDHADGSSIGEVQLVRLLFVHQTADLGQSSLDLAPLTGGSFTGEGAYLNRVGPWDVSIYVRRRGMDDTLITTVVDVPAPATGGSPWQNPIRALPVGVVAGSTLAALMLVPLLWYRARR